MLAMMPPAALGVVVAAMVGLAAYAVVRARGAEREPGVPSASTPGMFAGLGRRRARVAYGR